MLELSYVDIETVKKFAFALKFTDHNLPGLKAAYQLSKLPIVVNRETMRIVSSQGVVAAWEKSPEPVPVLFGRWLPQVEKVISIVLNGGIDNRLSSLPQDADVVDLLMNIDANLIPALGIDHNYAADILEIAAHGKIVSNPSLEPRPVLGNEWGIPTLDVNRQPSSLGEPLKWGTVRRSKPASGATIHFYTLDEKFTALLKEPLQLVNTQCLNAVEMNISMNPAMPRCYALNIIYQKRKVSTIWQESGVPVFVDMNVPEKFFDLNMLGVPVRWRAYANRAYSGELEHLEKAHALAVDRAGGDVFYVVYGGGKPARDLCASRGWEWIPEDATVKRGNNGEG